MNPSIVCWFSGGVTSAVATKITLEANPPGAVEIVFFETGNHHPDNARFFRECEAWFGQSIATFQHEKHKDIDSVFRKERLINTPFGAPCTKILKKQMRFQYERENPEIEAQVFGFEDEKRERVRAERFSRSYPHTNAQFPLIEAGLTKADCITILTQNRIDLPAMYHLGFSNNNCIGCVKGGMGYWNHTRIHFPEVFARMAALERELGGSCINGVYLDELDPSRGRHEPLDLPECGIFCNVNE
jgi:3'-phosphoadenosine 5'-phosphosulfate sulfotransferase (PAPS reductase)/FAD synthetase